MTLCGFRWTGAALTVSFAVLALVPAGARADPELTVSMAMPTPTTVGQTLSASFELTNNSTTEDPSFTICDAGDAGSCAGSEGIILIPSCGQDQDDTCTSAGADPGVFSINQPGTGAEGSACADMTFLTPSVDETFGKVRFAPTGGLDITLSQPGDTCHVDFTFTVLKLPTIDARAQRGVQTAAIVNASARTYLDEMVFAGASSVLTVIPHPPPAAPWVTATEPDSPANDNAPEVMGTAPAGTTVSVYTNRNCTGSPVAQGTKSAFASPGLTAAVSDKLDDHVLRRGDGRDDGPHLRVLDELAHVRGRFDSAGDDDRFRSLGRDR